MRLALFQNVESRSKQFEIHKINKNHFHIITIIVKQQQTKNKQQQQRQHHHRTIEWNRKKRAWIFELTDIVADILFMSYV